ncbi:MAG: hypothetical protein KME16_19475 [Scytolyngbya sp. HA4215-MV1]|jgi:hypothetical protein|nr:hypothetical protein [Scytolyngbya sp. HA4215-MV1]
MMPISVKMTTSINEFDSILETIPPVVNEQTVTLFYFYMDGAVYEGMRYQNELYQLECQFDIYSSSTAYRSGCELLQKMTGKIPFEFNPVIISASRLRYGVWLSLRAL